VPFFLRTGKQLAEGQRISSLACTLGADSTDVAGGCGEIVTPPLVIQVDNFFCSADENFYERTVILVETYSQSFTFVKYK
jgi:hypothetical protein